jgi:GAF domain-containing protein
MPTTIDPGRQDAFLAARSQLRSALEAGGPRRALEYLNSRTPHRFTAMYRFDDATLRNLVFYDADHPDVEHTDAIPVLASYCVFVRDANATFSTTHAARDDRVGDHPKRQVLQAYCGVPLRDEEGRMFGTICHFDFDPMEISGEEVELMEAVAPMLRRALGRAGG